MSKSFSLSKASQSLTTVLFIAGWALLGWLFYKLGPSTVWGYLQTLGWNFIPIFFLSVLMFVCFALSWGEFLRAKRIAFSFWKLLMVKVVGEGVNTMTPLNWGGGDPLRVYLLKDSIPISHGTASVVIDRTLHSLALILFMVVGILLALVAYEFPFSYQAGFVVSLLLMVGITYYFYRKQRQGLFYFLMNLLIRLRIKRKWSDKTRSQIQEVDQSIREFYIHHRKSFWMALFFHLVARLLGVLEIGLASYFLGHPIGWVASYLLLSITAIVNMIFVFIPGSVGVLEGSYAAIFHFFHDSPAIGIAIQMVRRIRTLLWAVVGFGYLYFLRRKKPAEASPPVSIKE